MQRKRPVPVLWRDNDSLADWPDDEHETPDSEPERGPAAGLVLARRGKLVAGHTWDGLDAERFDNAAAITKVLRASISTDLLRSVLRRPGDPRALLGEAVELLGLPPASLLLLDDSMPETAEAVEANPNAAHTYLPFLRTAHSALPRWWAVAGWLLPALVALQFAIRVLVAALDKSGGRTDDIICFSALGLIAGSFASWWFWFSRRLS